MSTLRVTTLATQAGVEVYTAKAWVNFNGTGTVAIRASGNVSSITDNGTGTYTINLTVAMPDANYSVSAIGDSSGARLNTYGRILGTLSAGSYQLRYCDDQSTNIDPVTACSSVFR